MKVARLGGSQAQIADILGLTQQSVSGKLTGKIAITLRDTAKLADHYDVPTMYFVGPEALTPDLAEAFETILSGPEELKGAMHGLSTLPRPFTQELLRIVQAVRQMEEQGKVTIVRGAADDTWV